MSHILTQDKPGSPEGLLHYGVKGMRWGARKDDSSGISRRTAEKDAVEFARAKMFYGDGAGTRRKLIREKVNSRKKADPNYAKAFDEAYERQDLGRHGDKARSERKRKDAGIKTKQRLGYAARLVTGERGTQAAFMAVAVAGGVFLQSPKGRELVRKGLNVAEAQKHKRAGKAFADSIWEAAKNG